MSHQLEKTLFLKNIKPTAMRLLVLEYLLDQNAAISLPVLEKHFSYSDRTTIYRTLKTFEDGGLIHSINDDSGVLKYAMCSDECVGAEHTDLHLHFHCSLCNETVCLPKTKVPKVHLPANFQLDNLELIAKGICDKCSEKNAIQLHEG